MAKTSTANFWRLVLPVFMISRTTAIPQLSSVTRTMAAELGGASTSVADCPSTSQTPWPATPCQISLGSKDATLRVVSYSPDLAPATEQSNLYGTLSNILTVLSYELGDEPLAGFTRKNGTVQINVAPETTTVPLIDDYYLGVVNRTREDAQINLTPDSWRIDVSLQSKLQQKVLYLAWLKIYMSPNTYNPRTEVNYEIWGNATLGLLGKVWIRVGAE